MGRLDKAFCASQKYHFRYYRPSRNHPFLVAILFESIDEEGKAYLSGFNMTHSYLKVLESPNDYIRIDNPNPDDDAKCYVQVHPIKNKPLKLFSSPIKNWKLTEQSEKIIDELVSKKLG